MQWTGLTTAQRRQTLLLVLNAGELSSALLPRADTQDATVTSLADPPLSLLSEGGMVTLRFTKAAEGQPRLHVTVAANATGPERGYVFAPVGASETSPGVAPCRWPSAVRRMGIHLDPS